MEKRLADIYKEIQESLVQKAKVGNNNDDNEKKHEERNTTIMDMFLDPTPIIETDYSIEEYTSPDKRVKK